MRKLGSARTVPPGAEGRCAARREFFNEIKPLSFEMNGQNGSVRRLFLPAKIRLRELNIKCPFPLSFPLCSALGQGFKMAKQFYHLSAELRNGVAATRPVLFDAPRCNE